MAIMMSKLFAALREAGAPEDKAREAAEEAAEFDNRITDIKATMKLHTWVLSFNTAMLVALVGKAFLGH